MDFEGVGMTPDDYLILGEQQLLRLPEIERLNYFTRNLKKSIRKKSYWERNFHCFKNLKSCKVLRPFWDKNVDFIFIVDKVNCCNKYIFNSYRKIYIYKITEF